VKNKYKKNLISIKENSIETDYSKIFKKINNDVTNSNGNLLYLSKTADNNMKDILRNQFKNSGFSIYILRNVRSIKQIIEYLISNDKLIKLSHRSDEIENWIKEDKDTVDLLVYLLKFISYVKPIILQIQKANLDKNSLNRICFQIQNDRIILLIQIDENNGDISRIIKKLLQYIKNNCKILLVSIALTIIGICFYFCLIRPIRTSNIKLDSSNISLFSVINNASSNNMVIHTNGERVLDINIQNITNPWCIFKQSIFISEIQKPDWIQLRSEKRFNIKRGEKKNISVEILNQNIPSPVIPKDTIKIITNRGTVLLPILVKTTQISIEQRSLFFKDSNSQIINFKMTGEEAIQLSLTCNHLNIEPNTFRLDNTSIRKIAFKPRTYPSSNKIKGKIIGQLIAINNKIMRQSQELFQIPFTNFIPDTKFLSSPLNCELLLGSLPDHDEDIINQKTVWAKIGLDKMPINNVNYKIQWENGNWEPLLKCQNNKISISHTYDDCGIKKVIFEIVDNDNHILCSCKDSIFIKPFLIPLFYTNENLIEEAKILLDSLVQQEFHCITFELKRGNPINTIINSITILYRDRTQSSIAMQMRNFIDDNSNRTVSIDFNMDINFPIIIQIK
jgi:hypothetical protein